MPDELTDQFFAACKALWERDNRLPQPNPFNTWYGVVRIRKITKEFSDARDCLYCSMDFVVDQSPRPAWSQGFTGTVRETPYATYDAEGHAEEIVEPGELLAGETIPEGEQVMIGPNGLVVRFLPNA